MRLIYSMTEHVNKFTKIPLYYEGSQSNNTNFIFFGQKVGVKNTLKNGSMHAKKKEIRQISDAEGATRMW